MSKKLYLANPYGFSKQTKTLLNEFIKIFNDLYVEVFEPFERAKRLTQHESEWAYEVARSNFLDLKECDCIFAIVNGNPPDEGVMIELGIAIALNKIYSSTLKDIFKLKTFTCIITVYLANFQPTQQIYFYYFLYLVMIQNNIFPNYL